MQIVAAAVSWLKQYIAARVVTYQGGASAPSSVMTRNVHWLTQDCADTTIAEVHTRSQSVPRSSCIHIISCCVLYRCGIQRSASAYTP